MGPTNRGITGQRMSDSSATFSGQWASCGMLRHLKVHFVQHDILWAMVAVRRIAKFEIYIIAPSFPNRA